MCVDTITVSIKLAKWQHLFGGIPNWKIVTQWLQVFIFKYGHVIPTYEFYYEVYTYDMVCQCIVHYDHIAHQFGRYKVERRVLTSNESSVSDVLYFIPGCKTNLKFGTCN